MDLQDLVFALQGFGGLSPLLEDLEILKPSRKLAHLWVLEKMEYQGPLTFIHKAQALSVTELLEGKMVAARQ